MIKLYDGNSNGWVNLIKKTKVDTMSISFDYTLYLFIRKLPKELAKWVCTEHLVVIISV